MDGDIGKEGIKITEEQAIDLANALVRGEAAKEGLFAARRRGDGEQLRAFAAEYVRTGWQIYDIVESVNTRA